MEQMSITIPTAIATAILAAVGTWLKLYYSAKKQTAKKCEACQEHKTFEERLNEVEKVQATQVAILESINEAIKDIREDVKMVIKAQVFKNLK